MLNGLSGHWLLEVEERVLLVVLLNYLLSVLTRGLNFYLRLSEQIRQLSLSIYVIEMPSCIILLDVWICHKKLFKDKVSFLWSFIFKNDIFLYGYRTIFLRCFIAILNAILSLVFSVKEVQQLSS